MRKTLCNPTGSDHCHGGQAKKELPQSQSSPIMPHVRVNCNAEASERTLTGPLGESTKNDRTVTDEMLLQRHLDGDEQAFEALVKRYRRELFNFLARFTGNSALAEDVFQEAFLQVHISAARFDMSRRLKPWLFTIAANKARDALRSRSRRQAAPLDASVGGDDEHGSYADLMPANVPQPDESILNLETRRVVLEIVSQMPASLKTVLLLCYFHDFPYKDIAEMLSVPLGTVKSRLHAALKDFGRRWQVAAKRLGYEKPSDG